MPYKNLYNIVEKMVSHVLFTYNGLSCGIDPLSKEKIEVWCGDEYIIANSISEVFSVKNIRWKIIKKYMY